MCYIALTFLVRKLLVRKVCLIDGCGGRGGEEHVFVKNYLAIQRTELP